jgi:hypothetical protein
VAVDAFDRDGTNAEDFAKLATRTDTGPLATALRAHATFFQGRAQLNRDEYDGASASFERLRRDLYEASPWRDEATFYLGYSYARRPELEEDKERLFRQRARTCLESIDTFAQCPERTREAAAWLLKELQGEGSGPLLELARRMETIERAIDRERTGKPIQKKQEQVIAEIDRLIELMREKEGGG